MGIFAAWPTLASASRVMSLIMFFIFLVCLRVMLVYNWTGLRSSMLGTTGATVLGACSAAFCASGLCCIRRSQPCKFQRHYLGRCALSVEITALTTAVLLPVIFFQTRQSSPRILFNLMKLLICWSLSTALHTTQGDHGFSSRLFTN